MRIPARIVEHPFEALIAGALLLGLLFGSADRSTVDAKNAVSSGHAAAIQKL